MTGIEISQAKIKITIEPQFLATVEPSASGQKSNGPTGTMKWFPQITFRNITVTGETGFVETDIMTGTPYEINAGYDTKQQAVDVLSVWLGEKMIARTLFLLIWNEWFAE